MTERETTPCFNPAQQEHSSLPHTLIYFWQAASIKLCLLQIEFLYLEVLALLSHPICDKVWKQTQRRTMTYSSSLLQTNTNIWVCFSSCILFQKHFLLTNLEAKRLIFFFDIAWKCVNLHVGAWMTIELVKITISFSYLFSSGAKVHKSALPFLQASSTFFKRNTANKSKKSPSNYKSNLPNIFRTTWHF